MNAPTRNILLTEHKSKSTIKSLSPFSVDVQVSKVALEKSILQISTAYKRSGSEKSGSEEISIVNKCSLLQVAIRVER